MNYEQMSRPELLSVLHELIAADQHRSRRARRGEQRDSHIRVIELGVEDEAQHALKDSRSRFAELYEFAPVACCTLDQAGVVHELNLPAARLLGRERESIVGRPLSSVVQIEEPASYWSHLQACASGKSARTELRLRVPQGLIDIEAVSVPAPAGDRRARFRTAFIDVTSRKRAEAAREASHGSERRLRQRLEALDLAQIEALAALAAPGTQAVRQVMEVIVRRAGELSRAAWLHLELVRDAEQSCDLSSEPIELGARDFRAQSEIERLALRYGGRPLAHLSLARHAEDGPLSREDYAALEMLLERLSSALEVAHLHAVDAREKLRLSLLERVAAELQHAHDTRSVHEALRVVAGEVVPCFADVCTIHVLNKELELELLCARHVEREQERALREQLKDPELSARVGAWLKSTGTSGDAQLFRPDAGLRRSAGPGQERPELLDVLQTASLVVTPLFARDQLLGCMTFGHAHGTAYDVRLSWVQEIGERCASALYTACLLDELRSAVEARENLLAMISHDLKSPLNAISLSALSMAPEPPVPERRSSRRQLELIQRSAAHMSNMINDLLSTTMLETGSFRLDLAPLCPHALVDDACQLAEPLLKARALKLERQVAPQLPRVHADRERVLRVFSNLLGNAAKFTPSGGSVTLGAVQRGERVVFHVSDTGPGVREEQRQHLFERYWRGGAGGLGLGLYIAKSIVEAHGGRIWNADAAGQGAAFYFELPAYLQG